MSRKLLIMRHSIRVTEDENNCSITEKGIYLARNKCLLLNDIEKIITSPFNRARQTTDAINSVIPTSVEIDYNLCETFSDIYGNSNKYKGLSKEFIEELNNNGVNMPESREQIIERCNKIIERVNSCNEKSILLISHWGLINMLIKVLGYNQDFRGNYCECIEFINIDGKWSFSRYI